MNGVITNGQARQARSTSSCYSLQRMQQLGKSSWKSGNSFFSPISLGKIGNELLPRGIISLFSDENAGSAYTTHSTAKILLES